MSLFHPESQALSAKLSGTLESLSKLTDKEREAQPSPHFLNDYTAMRELAKKVNPAKEKYLPPDVAMATFGELYAYCSQIRNLLYPQ